MRVCAICHFDIDLDDQVVSHGGQTICLRCYNREVDRVLVMPKELRRDVIAVLESVQAL